MNLGLAGKTAIVGGASRGIGRAIASAFLQEGARVAMAARGADDLEAAARALREEFGADRVQSCAADVTSAEGVRSFLRSAIEAFGGIDVVVANVGRGSYPTGPHRPVDEWAEVLTTNLVGSMELMGQAIAELERNAAGGAIVCVGSIAGVEDVGAPATYAAAKAGLLAATKALARILAPRIRVNAVAPGNVLFPGGSWDRKLSERRDEIEAMIKREVPLQRFGVPEEIARAVVFLASPAAAFTTGSCLVVDGGQTRSW